MKVVLEKEKENVVKLDITIPAKDAVDAYNNAVRKISQYVNIDGFRRGKAPRAVVERHVGTERIKQEAIESLMPRAINQAVADNKLDLIAQPYVTNYNFNIGEDLTVTAKAELRPEVTLGQYKDLTVEEYINNIKADLALKSEVYKKTETYSKQETYSKEELYPKSNFAIIEFSKDVEVKDAQYPEGFTRDNCIVVSVMRSDYNPKKMWSNTKHCTKQIPNGDNEPITIGWNEPVADVTLYESYIGLSNWDVYYDYRVVLMKV